MTTTSALPVTERGYQTDATSSWWGTIEQEHEETPELRWPESVAVYDRMRTDAQVQSVLRGFNLPIIRADWWIDGTGCRDEVTRQIADDLGLPVQGDEASRRRLRTKHRFSWTEFVRLTQLQYVFGHAVFEPVYSIDAGRARLRKLAYRPPRTISRWNVARDGGLVSVQQQGTRSPIPVDRLVVYVSEREGGNWMGRSLLRSAYRYDLLKTRMLRTQAQAGERQGMGVPVYIGPDFSQNTTLDAAQIQALQQADLTAGLAIAQQMRAGENSGAAIPFGAKVRLVGVEGQLPDLDKQIRYYDEQIARSMLLHFLNLGSETGSWALGTTFAEFFALSLQAVADQLADVTNAHVIEDLVDANWGPDEPAPRLVHEEIGSKSPATAEAIRALIDCGAVTADLVTEQHLRQRFGLPPLAGERPDPTNTTNSSTQEVPHA